MGYRWPLKAGDRVALAPHTDLWMQGVRFADVIEVWTAQPGPPATRTYEVSVQHPNGNRERTRLNADEILGAVN